MSELVLVVTLAGTLPIRLPLTRRITSLGSDPTADIQLATAPAHWAIVHRVEDHVEIVLPEDGTRHALQIGERLDAGRFTLALESTSTAAARARVIDELVSALAAVESPERAIELMLAGLIAAADADLGVLILQEGASYGVAAARDRDGAVLATAAELLSDTIVTDVLGTGERLQLDDLAAHSRYAAQPSIAAMRIASATCLPLRLEGRVLGVVFLARHRRTTLDDGALAELRVLAAIAVPFLAALRRSPRRSPDELVGESDAMGRLKNLVARVGPSDLSALLHGPSGSGKELVARAIHAASPRAAKPMIAINCASVAPTLLDAELFGYRKGAFTGAVADRIGLVEAADESTLFLDEIGDMPMPMQAALLRVLEQREVKRLGDTSTRPVNFRLICATHKALDAEVAAGRFRADLLFRLREVTLEVPSLAERGADIELLAYTFLRQAEAQLGLAAHTLTGDALAVLRTHAWPGNVRELKAAMRRAAILADSKLIRAVDLGLGPDTPAPAVSSAGPAGELRVWLDGALGADAVLQPLSKLRDELVRRYVLFAIERCGDDREAAARALEIGVRSLYRYIS